MKKVEIPEVDYRQILKVQLQTRDRNISDRLKILLLFYEGMSAGEIARATGRSRSGVYRVYERYQTQGLAEFARQKYTSHRRLLTEAEEDEILAPFANAAETGQTVTAADIKLALDGKIGRDTSPAYVRRLLKRHGWTIAESVRPCGPLPSKPNTSR